MAQRQALRQQQEKAAAAKAVVDETKARQEAIANGQTVNNLLEQVLELNPSGITSPASKMPLTASAVRDIAFETATEPISFCMNQLTDEDAWPYMLKQPPFAKKRLALREAVLAVLREDVKGNVAKQKARKATTQLKDAVRKSILDTDPEYLEADSFLRTLSSLTRLLDNPRFQKALADIETFPNGILGRLVAFMQAFNLRFAPAKSERQIELFTQVGAGVLPDASRQRRAFADETEGRTGGSRFSVRRQARYCAVWDGMTWRSRPSPDASRTHPPLGGRPDPRAHPFGRT